MSGLTPYEARALADEALAEFSDVTYAELSAALLESLAREEAERARADLAEARLTVVVALAERNGVPQPLIDETLDGLAQSMAALSGGASSEEPTRRAAELQRITTDDSQNEPPDFPVDDGLDLDVDCNAFPANEEPSA